MGRMESESRRRSHRKNVKKIILQTVAVAGVVGAGLVAPNVLGAMATLGLLPNKRQKEIIQASRDRLVRQGLLVYEGKMLRLTAVGKKTLRTLEIQNYQIEKPKWWDKKWRVLIFDIPERKKGLRDKVRRTLISNSFLRLQNSV